MTNITQKPNPAGTTGNVSQASPCPYKKPGHQEPCLDDIIWTYCNGECGKVV